MYYTDCIYFRFQRVLRGGGSRKGCAQKGGVPRGGWEYFDES